MAIPAIAMDGKKKILRDLVHGYINLEEIDLLIIDTPYFQRLKDIRQLTCQHVYPDARHTRFEHSLGVLELTRQAVKHIKSNGYLSSDKPVPIDDDLERDTALAALLHDVGHCPFSHLGERQFEEDGLGKNPREELCEQLEKLRKCRTSGKDEFDELKKSLQGKESSKTDKPAIHEILSCIVILDKYVSLFQNP